MSLTMRKSILVLAAIAVAFVLGLTGCSAGTSASGASAASAGSENGDFNSVGDVSATASDTMSSEDAAIQQKIDSMTLEQKVAQLFIVSTGSLYDLDDGNGDPLARYQVGGILLNGSDLDDPEQTRTMLADFQERSLANSGLPLFLCVDEEGGTVVRVSDNPAFGVDNVGDMAAIGATGDAQAAGDAARYIGTYLADLGFNVDFAPVADLAGGDDFMALRSFGTDADLVAGMVTAQVQAFRDAGVLCSVKHFPGIGGIKEDSHDESIFNHQSMDELHAGALVPFKAGIEAGAPFVMIGHLSTPEATGDDMPASLSSAWMVDVLRDELGFEGVAITDSLGMGAVESRCSQAELGALCLKAGADVLLNPEEFPAMYQGVLDAVARGELSEDRIDEALGRVLLAKAAL